MEEVATSFRRGLQSLINHSPTHISAVGLTLQTAVLQLTTKGAEPDIVKCCVQLAGSIPVPFLLSLDPAELGQLSGVAAILRFPLTEIESDDGEEDDAVD